MNRVAITPDQFSSFGELLKYLRRREGLTQRELAIAVGYSDTQISRIEKDSRIPDSATLKALFVPALHLEREPEWVERMLELASSVRHEESSDSNPDATANNLPVSLTTFIGREKELEEVLQLIGRNRLVTLAGSGGIGKTRLAIKTGEHVMGDFADGVWLVELAPLASPDLIFQTMAGVLGNITQAAVSETDQLINYLRSKRILLILDNCEHLLDACALSADAILSRCPGVKVLATSRQSLGVPGEIQYQVPTLTLPGAYETTDRIQEFEAVRLFVERARLVRGDFSLTPDNAPSILRICSRVDGIPLAIELAAARLNMFSAVEIAARLESSFGLLTGGSRTAMPRQQTLRASIDWSWELLSEMERILIRRLTVFAGGWTLEAAESVCSLDGEGSMDVLANLSRLVERSLVIVEQSGRETRYSCHEVIRQYAQEKLAGSGEVERVRRSHLQYFLALAAVAEPALHSLQQVEWYDRLKEERDNFRSALEYASQVDLKAGLNLSAMLSSYWVFFDLHEGLRWITEFLQRPASKDYRHERAAALQVQGSIYWYFQQFEAARAVLEESLALFSGLDDLPGEIDVLLTMGGVLQFLEGMEQGNEYRYRGLAQARSIGDLWRQALALDALGWDQRDPAQALLNWEEAIRLYRQLGDLRNLEHNLGILAFTLMSNGEVEAAQKYLEEAVEVNRRTNDRRNKEFTLTGRSLLALMNSEFGLARALLQENIEIHEDIGNRMGYLWGRARLGYVAFRSGNLAEAEQLYSSVIREFHSDHNRSGLAYALDRMAGLCVVQSKFETAAQLIGWSDTARREVGDPRPRIEQDDLDRDIAAIKKKLTPAGYKKAYATGGRMTLDEAVALVIEPEN